MSIVLHRNQSMENTNRTPLAMDRNDHLRAVFTSNVSDQTRFYQYDSNVNRMNFIYQTQIQWNTSFEQVYFFLSNSFVPIENEYATHSC
jgi:hypothetical protein